MSSEALIFPISHFLKDLSHSVSYLQQLHAIEMLVAVSNPQDYCSPAISHQQYPMSIMTVCLLPGLLSNVDGSRPLVAGS